MKYYSETTGKYGTIYPEIRFSPYAPSRIYDNPPIDYARSDWQPPDGILEGKASILEARIKEIISDIGVRQKLKDAVFYKITYQELQTDTKLLQLDSWNRAPGESMILDRRRAHLERLIMDLEKSKLQEEVCCWRDAAALKKELRDVIAQYRDIKRKEKMLEE